MAFYLMRFSYTPETWSKLMQNPEDRRDAARAYIEQVGGALHGFWYGFGKYDGYAIFEAPDNVSVAACRDSKHGRRRPSLGRDNGADERGRDAGGTREGQGHWLPPPRRVASDLRASFPSPTLGE